MDDSDKEARARSFALNQGPAIIAAVGPLVVIYLAVAYMLQGGYIAMLPLVMKPTAWLAFALFIMAFTASSLRRLYPGTYSRWAIKNRRYLGLSFALTHFIHAGLVLSNLGLTEESREPATLVVGGMAYVFLALMALTSNNASVRKLGAKNWKRLHKVGSYYIWLIFMATTLPALPLNWPWGGLIPLVGLLALMVRIQAARKLKK